MLTDKETNTPKKKEGCDYSRLSLKELISRSVYDPKACWELFREGTEQNDRDAEVYLARCEENIRNLSNDNDRLELYLKLADLHERRGEREKSGAYYGLAGEMGDTQAQLKSAEIFLEEASEETDPAKKEEKADAAMQLLESLSESGTVPQKYRRQTHWLPEADTVMLPIR